MYHPSSSFEEIYPELFPVPFPAELLEDEGITEEDLAEFRSEYYSNTPGLTRKAIAKYYFYSMQIERQDRFYRHWRYIVEEQGSDYTFGDWVSGRFSPGSLGFISPSKWRAPLKKELLDPDECI